MIRQTCLNFRLFPVLAIFILGLGACQNEEVSEANKGSTVDSQWVGEAKKSSDPQEVGKHGQTTRIRIDGLASDLMGESLVPFEKSNLSLFHFLENYNGGSLEQSAMVNNKDLAARSIQYQSLVNQVQAEYQEILSRIDTPYVKELSDAKKYPAGNVARIFDERWLTSNEAAFQLVGIVQRFDRKIFSDSDHCGELRFIYRLYYRIEQERVVSSKLPWTFNAVASIKNDCQSFWSNWNEKWSKGQELHKLQLAMAESSRRLEFNAQIYREPSGLATEFAGQAIYWLKSFEVSDSNLAALPLENTPDLNRLKNSKSLQLELKEFLDKHQSQIEKGRVLIPKKFLAYSALSHSTLGENRIENKPWTRLKGLLTKQKVSSLVLDQPLLEEKLNNRTCMGCHQAGSTAGFHLLGQADHKLDGATNRLALPGSIHYLNDQIRREEFLKQSHQGQEHLHEIPLSLDPIVGEAKLGESCALNSGWKCSPGLECRTVVSNDQLDFHYGKCLPSNDTPSVGALCREGEILSNDSVSLKFLQKQIYGLREDKVFSTDELNCRPTRIGVPLGRVYAPCTDSQKRFDEFQEGKPWVNSICGIVGGSKFDTCVEENFHNCLESVVGRGMMRSCDSSHPCREDYICQQFPLGLGGLPEKETEDLVRREIGFCTPTYFLFQLRLDGHPVP